MKHIESTFINLVSLGVIVITIWFIMAVAQVVFEEVH